jgi:hypothetical protein
MLWNARTPYLLRRVRLLATAAMAGFTGLSLCAWLLSVLPPPNSVHSSSGKAQDRWPGIY